MTVLSSFGEQPKIYYLPPGWCGILPTNAGNVKRKMPQVARRAPLSRRQTGYLRTSRAFSRALLAHGHHLPIGEPAREPPRPTDGP
jgi:hypothetical protein